MSCVPQPSSFPTHPLLTHPNALSQSQGATQVCWCEIGDYTQICQAQQLPPIMCNQPVPYHDSCLAHLFGQKLWALHLYDRLNGGLKKPCYKPAYLWLRSTCEEQHQPPSGPARHRVGTVPAAAKVLSPSTCACPTDIDYQHKNSPKRPTYWLYGFLYSGTRPQRHADTDHGPPTRSSCSASVHQPLSRTAGWSHMPSTPVLCEQTSLVGCLVAISNSQKSTRPTSSTQYLLTVRWAKHDCLRSPCRVLRNWDGAVIFWKCNDTLFLPLIIEMRKFTFLSEVIIIFINRHIFLLTISDSNN